MERIVGVAMGVAGRSKSELGKPGGNVRGKLREPSTR